ncbi:DUF7314 family protein [Halomarina ordinaria]|uniref:DUF7314 domain-containing protein n=1 Tax=Halomarina ordinaria TaxID=3033939 RepID=A0ABD5UDJ9_9EURY|nr:hypothetical protein [Halomarina sp. PSRA2]
MADEFIKGLTALIVGLFGWLTFAGWYRTPSFSGAQLVGPLPEDPNVYDQIGLVLMDAMFYFAILGALTFWVIIPAIRQIRLARSG